MALKLAAAIIVPALLAALMGTSALAMFTDTDSVSNNAFIRGTGDISTTPNTARHCSLRPGRSGQHEGHQRDRQPGVGISGR